MKKVFFFIATLLIGNMVGFSQCPDPNVTAQGFNPSSDSLDCVERGLAYSQSIQVNVPPSISLPTVGNAAVIFEIVNIIGLPSGISYTCSPGCTINGGATGCLNFYGTTNAPAGTYPLTFYVTLSINMPVIGPYTIGPATVDSIITQFASLGTVPTFFTDIVYELRVIEQGGACATTIFNQSDCSNIQLSAGQTATFSDAFFVSGSSDVWNVNKLSTSTTGNFATDYDIFLRNPNGTKGAQVYDGWYDYDQGFNRGYYDLSNPPVESFNTPLTVNASDGFIHEATFYNNSASSVSVTMCMLIDYDVVPVNYSISTSVTGNSFCAGGTASVPFSASGSYNPGNVFTAQLSNASGSFTSPVAIGTLNSTASGTISATIPQNTTIGFGYRIRVVSNDPPIAGSDNGSDLTISNSCLILTAASATVLPGSQVVVPVTVSGFQSIAGAQGSIQFNSSVISFVQAEQFGLSGLSASNFAHPSAGKLTFLWDDATAQGVSLANGSVLFVLRFNVVGTAGQQSAVEFVNSPTVLEFNDPQGNPVSAQYIAGAIHIESSIFVKGSVKTETAQAVKTVTMSLTGQSAQSTSTAVDGSYSLYISQGGNYTVTPSKSNDVTTNNGITTGDILLIRRHILGTQPLATPYKIIAADVNGSSSVTTADILLMRSVILTITSTFPNGKLWAFTPSNYVFANPSTPFPYATSLSYTNISQSSNQDFIGMKLGDVNNSWDPGIAKTGATGNVQFAMDEYSAMPGDEMIIPVKVKDFNDVTGYQFTISWNPEVLTLSDVSNKSLSGYFGKEKISEGYLTTSWDDEMARAVSLDDDEVAFELKFNAIGENGTSSEIKINSVLTAAEAYNGNLDLLEIKSTNGIVKVGDVSSIIYRLSSIINLQVQPNPFTNSTQIIFDIPKDERVSITIYDILGKAVKQLTGNYSAGTQHIEWMGDDDSGNALSKGLYHIRMQAEKNSIGMKAMLLR